VAADNDTDGAPGAAPIDPEAVAQRSEPPPEVEDASQGGEETLFKRRLKTCPVHCLGARDGRYFFRSPRGELRDLPYNHLRPAGIESLFDGDVSWLFEHFPRHSRDSDDVVGWVEASARAFLIKACSSVYFRVGAVRGPGVWAEPGGRLVVHIGGALQVWQTDRETDEWLPGDWESLDRRDGRTIYVLGDDHTIPADEPCPAADVHRVHAELGTWSYRQQLIMPRLVLGWVAMVALHGAHEFSPHLILTGDSGWGKSALIKSLKALSGPSALGLKAPTEPAVRQMLGWSASPFFIEESEASSNPQRAAEIFDMLPIASGADDLGTARGGRGGDAVQYPMRAMFLLNAVNLPPLRPQVENRTVVVDMARLPGEAKPSVLKRRVRWLEGLAAGWRRRALEAWPRAQQNYLVWQDALQERGYSQRERDVLGQILAWADAMLQDDAVESIPTDLLELVPPPQRRYGDDNTDPWRCWTHLATQTIEREYKTDFNGEERRQRERMLVGDALVHAVKHPHTTYHTALRAIGLRVMVEGDPKMPATFVVVANQHSALERLFVGTHWAGKGWVRSLGNLPMAFHKPGAVRFSSGIQQRGVWIPADALLPRDEGEADAPTSAAGERVREPPVPGGDDIEPI